MHTLNPPLRDALLPCYPSLLRLGHGPAHKHTADSAQCMHANLAHGDRPCLHKGINISRTPFCMRAAFDKGDLLYLRDEEEKRRFKEEELRDSERAQFLRMQASSGAVVGPGPGPGSNASNGQAGRPGMQKDRPARWVLDCIALVLPKQGIIAQLEVLHRHERNV